MRKGSPTRESCRRRHGRQHCPPPCWSAAAAPPQPDSAAESTVAAESTAEDAEKTADEGDADEVAAKNCADLIDAIYVQERSADTDAPVRGR